MGTWGGGCGRSPGLSPNLISDYAPLLWIELISLITCRRHARFSIYKKYSATKTEISAHTKPYIRILGVRLKMCMSLTF